VTACDDCLRRTDLIAALAGRIEIEWRLRTGRPLLLALSDERLLDWAGDAAVSLRYAGFDRAVVDGAMVARGVRGVCRCDPRYPAALRDLPDPPAVLHFVGDPALLERPARVGVVGSRRCSTYGEEVARQLGRGLAAADVVVVSGMALGVDSAAHEGALEAGATIAVLATGADRPYPARKRLLHERIARSALVVSEMPPGFAPHRWGFPARNRIIAALSQGTVVVEGTIKSGSLITADFAAELGRFVAAVPGRVTATQSAGPNMLIKTGAELVREAADVLDLLAEQPPAEDPWIIGVGDAAGPPAAPRHAPPRDRARRHHRRRAALPRSPTARVAGAARGAGTPRPRPPLVRRHLRTGARQLSVSRAARARTRGSRGRPCAPCTSATPGRCGRRRPRSVPGAPRSLRRRAPGG
jgi:DNA processing protein